MHVVARNRAAFLTGLATLVTGAVALSSATVSAAVPHATVAVGGAGSTFVAPLMIGQWIPGYMALHANGTITYAPIGSGAGIVRWTAGKADFAASDALLTSSQDSAAAARCGTRVVKIPATISAVAIIFNVPGVQSGLKLSPGVIANIFLGKVTNWSDSSIKAVNPGVALPNLPIQIVHRSDGSGTTYITTHFLAAVSAAWKSGPGAGTKVNWPAGIGAKGSAGIVNMVTTTLGAISYVDLAYAVQNNIDYARIQNAQGQYVTPDTSAASVAADSFASSMPSDLQQIIVNSQASGAYPITGYSYVFLCGRQPGATGHTLVDFVRYAVTAGQASVKTLFYAPLPASVARLDTAVLDKIATT